MKKSELIDAVVEVTGESKATIEKVVSGLVDVIRDAVKEDEKVFLANLGTFELAVRKERQGVNPASGEKITIPEKKLPKFKVAKSFKDYLA